MPPSAITVGVLALQGGVVEHIALLNRASTSYPSTTFHFLEVRTPEQLSLCDALIIPGGESTTMAIVARRLGLLEPLREFVKINNRPVWGTCAGLVMLAEQASATKQGGQELIGGLDVRVLRNKFGTQVQSFVADLKLDFLGEGEGPFRGVFIRAPVVEEVINGNGSGNVKVLGTVKKPGEEADIVAVRQGNVFGTSFHPELTGDVRVHVWWLGNVVEALSQRRKERGLVVGSGKNDAVEAA
ncbi:putative glutamine amidotransferase subunit [Triangularia setosa]|uniref:glutaminase n=1 Tax=Triangularia setosa TaxID=2587417 RepID=A0AAN6VXA1_9PEZI|nr:putative glutamine amidotransferase subunit [Podospora setosa]